MSLMQDVLLQTLYYFIAMMLPLLLVGFLMRGFFWKYLKVRMSMNRLLLVKSRTLLRDHYFIGRIQEGFLIYKMKKEKDTFEARISISQDDYKAIYRTIGINMIDIDEEKSAICRSDYSTVSGFDVKKYCDLMIRCLQRPIIGSQFEKIIIGLVILAILVGLGAVYMSYQGYNISQQVQTALPTVCKTVITSVAGKV